MQNHTIITGSASSGKTILSLRMASLWNHNQVLKTNSVLFWKDTFSKDYKLFIIDEICSIRSLKSLITYISDNLNDNLKVIYVLQTNPLEEDLIIQLRDLEVTPNIITLRKHS